MKKLEKKQIPQFAALCVLSAGLLGYFVVRLITPSPAAAGTRPLTPPKAAAPVAGIKPAGDKTVGDKKAEAAPDSTPLGADTGAPPPTPGMHDPFVVGYVDPKTLPATPATLVLPGKTGKQIASLQGIAPVSALPLGFQSLPVPTAAAVSKLPAAPKLPSAPTVEAPPAPPTWSVTGVLQGDGGQVAILRSGEARRIVHAGDFADSVYRVAQVSRTEVVLRHGTAVYHLPIGAVKPAPAKMTLGTTLAMPAAGASAPPDKASAAWQQMLLLDHSSPAP